jgi:hypothetical protein
MRIRSSMQEAVSLVGRIAHVSARYAPLWRTRRRHSLLALAAASSCGGDAAPTPPTPPARPAPAVLLKDITIPSLPSPYYPFEYAAAARVTGASFASGLTIYDVRYANGRISEMRNTTLGNKDRLVYLYDAAGRVSEVRYTDPTGVVYTRLHLAYDGKRLTRVERERRSVGGFAVDKTMSLAYDADGNLAVVTDHRPAIAGAQDEATFVDHFEHYDGGVNVDGFGLLHNDFFDHLVLLPDVQLQKGNPLTETRTGDGINYRVEYSYTYDDRKQPLAKRGELTLLNGPDAGRRFQTGSVFSYY